LADSDGEEETVLVKFRNALDNDEADDNVDDGSKREPHVDRMLTIKHRHTHTHTKKKKTLFFASKNKLVMCRFRFSLGLFQIFMLQ
jgi:DNA polymerase III delta subunit